MMGPILYAAFPGQDGYLYSSYMTKDGIWEKAERGALQIQGSTRVSIVKTDHPSTNFLLIVGTGRALWATYQQDGPGDDPDWSQPEKIANGAITNASTPALVPNGNQVDIVYLGKNNNLNWLHINAYDDEPADPEQGLFGDSRTNGSSPTMLRYDNSLHLLFLGKDKRMYLATCPTATWSQAKQIYSHQTSGASMSACVHQEGGKQVLYMSWLGKDKNLNVTSFDGKWSEKPHLGLFGITTCGVTPAMFSHQGKLHVIWLGKNKNLNMGTWDGKKWTSAQGLFEGRQAYGVTPTAFAYGGKIWLSWLGGKCDINMARFDDGKWDEPDLGLFNGFQTNGTPLEFWASNR